MTKEEFLIYKQKQQQQQAHARIYKLAGIGQCKPLTDDEWLSIETKGLSLIHI